MIPHRPWPLLVLSLALWTGATSAQTWTTVWTPDAAPAARTKMEPKTDHSSKTNCYPCKEWEDYGDGTGKWVDYPDYTPCGTCGCCEGGNCVEYTNNCPNPLPVLETKLNKTGSCPCTDPGAGGCVIPEIWPPLPPMPEYSVCLGNCNWLPVLESFTINYKEGLCLDRCQSQIASADDVTLENVCAVKPEIPCILTMSAFLCRML